ncbi:MAG: transcriptional regulator GcvA [Planctomycetes bacterium]|nr:transcriptional regulator GcvA [Planctomycetota bacterium]
MSLPSLTALRAFEAVARLGSFTRAADELFVTQGAISHQIRRLEEELGLRLFDRKHRHATLTPAGTRLSVASTDAFARLEEAVVSLTRRAPDTVLTVSVPVSLATRWLVPRLVRFREQEPELDVRISATSAWADPIREGFDLCIRYAKQVRQVGVAATVLVAEDVFPVCNPSLLRGRNALREPADLKTGTLLHVEPKIADPDLPDWRKWLRAARVTGVKAKVGPRFSHAGLALSAALAGQGVALGRTTLVADDLAAGRLVRPFESTFRSRIAYWLLTPTSEVTQEKTLSFRRWLEEEVERTQAECRVVS